MFSLLQSFPLAGIGNCVKLSDVHHVLMQNLPKKQKLVELNKECEKCFKLDLTCVGHSIKYKEPLMCFDAGPTEEPNPIEKVPLETPDPEPLKKTEN